jgi:hypothetical protein
VVLDLIAVLSTPTAWSPNPLPLRHGTARLRPLPPSSQGVLARLHAPRVRFSRRGPGCPCPKPERDDSGAVTWGMWPIDRSRVLATSSSCGRCCRAGEVWWRSG